MLRIIHSFGKVCGQIDPEFVFGLYLELSLESKSELSKGNKSTGERGEPDASTPFPSAYPCTLCCSWRLVYNLTMLGFW